MAFAINPYTITAGIVTVVAGVATAIWKAGYRCIRVRPLKKEAVAILHEKLLRDLFKPIANGKNGEVHYVPIPSTVYWTALNTERLITFLKEKVEGPGEKEEFFPKKLTFLFFRNIFSLLDAPQQQEVEKVGTLMQQLFEGRQGVLLDPQGKVLYDTDPDNQMVPKTFFTEAEAIEMLAKRDAEKQKKLAAASADSKKEPTS